MKIKYITDDIIKSKEKYIVHQTNCVTTYGKGLSELIFTKYPYADIYTKRKDKNTTDTPGKIIIRGNGTSERYIINLMGQYYPGKPTKELDTYKSRKKWFKDCLDDLLKIDKLESIAFPYKIGCGLAGGVWSEYLEMLEEFADETEAKVYIYQRKGDT